MKHMAGGLQVIKRGKAPSAMFLTLRGGVVCFDLSAGNPTP